MSTPILATKLYIPFTRTKLVSRPRLIRQHNGMVSIDHLARVATHVRVRGNTGTVVPHQRCRAARSQPLPAAAKGV